MFTGIRGNEYIGRKEFKSTLRIIQMNHSRVFINTGTMRKGGTVFSFFLIGISGLSAQQNPGYRDTGLPLEKRISALVSQMTLEEKVQQMMHGAPAIPRLDLPAYNWWNEALHGVARSANATVFPQAIGLGATFDEELVTRVACAVSDEARAIYNSAVKKEHRLRYGGLTFWTPNINIFRDPRWGRGQETYGEDPFLTSRLGVCFVRGLQGDDPFYLKTAACAKHFAVHSGPEKSRHEFNAVVTPGDLHGTYLPAFKALVENGVEAVMCAYNRTNDEPCCGSNSLLVELLRGRWNFKGHVVSDCWAIPDIHKGHRVTPGPVESVALSLKKGVNLNCGNEYYPYLLDAVKEGLVTEEEIDKSLSVLLTTRFRLGMFDPPEKNPYSSIPESVINSPEHRALALEAARESIVLLKNNGVLPLENDIPYLFITGPNASSVEALLGNYYGVNKNMVTILEGIAGHLYQGSLMQYKQGFLADRVNVNPIDWTSSDAKEADAIVVVMGLTGNLEGEEGESIASPHFGDRLEYDLPRNQVEFLKKLRENNTKPIIVVITSGSPVNMTEINELADAVIWAWYPGEEGGNAVADIIFGNISPSGRLPVTFPVSISQLPPYEDYNMKGRTYRFMTEEPFYPFGYGLSYTTFSYSDLMISSDKIKSGESNRAEVTVTNSGKRESDEVVQLYLRVENKKMVTPLFSLKGFKRVHLEPGESARVSFEITPGMMSVFNDAGEEVLERCIIRIFVGGSSPARRSLDLGINNILEARYSVR
jgi:beta-glucosidase